MRKIWSEHEKQLGIGNPIRLMIVCPKCGNKRCPKADGPQWKCNDSNEPGQIYELEASADEAETN